MFKRLQIYARFVKLEHTLFALPILLAGALLGTGHWPAFSLLGWMLVAATGARTFAFVVNRVIDREIDRANPRTANRELPSGQMSLREAGIIGIVSILLYFGSTAAIDPRLLLLSLIPLIIFCIYPWMKRFTPFAHLGVGASLLCAPVGAWLASLPADQGWTPSLSILLLAAFMFFWASGFDIIYATLDESFDRSFGLKSLPAVLGRTRALRISLGLHVGAFVSLSLLYVTEFRTILAGLFLGIIGFLLYLEGQKADDVDLAFFKINAVIGFLVLVFVWTGVMGL